VYTNRAMSPGPTNLLGCNNNNGPDPLNSVRQHLTKTLRTPPSYYYYNQQNHPTNDPFHSLSPLSTNSISMPSLISNNTNAMMRPPCLPPTRNQSFQPHLPAARKLSKLSNLCWVSSVSQPDLTLTTTTLSPVNSLPTSRASSPGAPLSRCTSPHPPPPLAGGSPYGSAYLVGRAGGGGGGGSLGGSQVGLSSLTSTTSSSSYYLNQLAGQQQLVRQQQQQQVPVYTSRFEQRQSAAAALLFPSSSSPPNHMFQPDPGPPFMSYHPQLYSHRSPEPQPAPFVRGGGGWSGSGGLLYSPPLPELLSPSYEQQQQFNAWNVSGGGGSMSPPPYPTEVLLSDINGNQQEWQQQEHKQQHWQQEHKQHWQQEQKQHWQQEHMQHWQPMVSACCSGVGGLPQHRIDLNQNHVGGGGGGEQRYLQQQLQQQQQLRASPSRSLAASSFPGGGGVEQGKPCAIIMPQQQQHQLLGREECGGCRCSSSSSPPSPLFGLPHASGGGGDMEQLYKQQQQRAVSVPRQTAAATSPQQPGRSLWLPPRLQRSVGTSCSDLLAWEQQQQLQEQFPASDSTAVVAATIPFVVEMCQICNVFLKGSGDGQCARPYYRYSPCQYGGQVVVAEGEGGQPPRRGPPAQLILKRWAQRPYSNQVLCYK
jgi:hypothetical protein